MDMIITSLIMLLLLSPASALQEFVSKHFAKKSVVVVSSNFRNLDEKLISILQLNQPKMIINEKGDHNLMGYDAYMIIESNSNRVSSTVDSLKHRMNSRSNFLVILSENITENDSKSILNNLFHSYIYNVVLYINKSSFVTWYPYNSIKSVDLVTVDKTIDPYRNKIPKNLHNYPFKVTWNYGGVAIKNPYDKTDPGYIIRVLDNVAEKINATLIYLTENVDYMTRGEKGRQLLGEDMLKRSIDLAVIASVVSMAPPGAETTISYSQSGCYFLLPPRRKIVNSMDTLVIFSPVIWSLILTTMVTMALLWKVTTQWSLQTSLFQIIRLVLQLSMLKIPNTTKSRLVFALFFFYVSHLNWTYVSQLSGILSRPSYEPKLDTLDDLGQSSKKLRIDKEWVMILASRNYTNVLERRIGIETEMTLDEEMKDFLKRQDYGIILSMNRILYVKNHHHLHLVSEKVAVVHYYLVVRRGFPCLEKMNHVIFKIVESGLVSKWLYESQITINKTAVSDLEEVVNRLDLDRILSAFVLLGLGFLVSIIVFFLELLRH